MILTNLFDHFYVFLRVAFAFLTALRVSVLKLLSFTFVTSRGNLDVLEGGRKRKYFSAPKFTAKDLAICKCCDQGGIWRLFDSILLFICPRWNLCVYEINFMFKKKRKKRKKTKITFSKSTSLVVSVKSQMDILRIFN